MPVSFSLLLAIGTLVAGVPFFLKHGPAPWLAIALHACLLAALATWGGRLGPRFAALATAGGVAGLTALGAAAYPWSRTVDSPSSAPDALIVPLQSILSGLGPYAQALPDAAPVSPGLAWSLLNAPVLLAGMPWLMTPIWVAIFAFVLARAAPRTWAAPLLVLLANPALAQAAAVGHDISAAGFALATGLVLVVRSPRPASIALLAIVATARLPFAAVAFAGAASPGRRSAWIAAGTGALVLHGIVATWCFADGLPYPPAHLFGRAHASLGTEGLIAGLLVWLLALAGVARASVGMTRPGALWSVSMLPFAAVGLAELAGHGDIATWEGKHYVAVGLPVYAAAWALAATEAAKAE